MSAMKASGRSCAHVRRAISGKMPMLDLRENVTNTESLALMSPISMTKPARMRELPSCQNGRYSAPARRSNVHALATSKEASLLASGFHNVLPAPLRALLQ